MTFTEQYVALTMAMLNADGKQEPEEIEVIKQVALNLDLNKDEVDTLIIAEVANPKKLEKVARSVKKKADAELLMEACVEVALADKYIDHREIDMLLSIASWMKLQPSKAVLAIATFAQNDRSILIEGNATLHTDEEIEVEED